MYLETTVPVPHFNRRGTLLAVLLCGCAIVATSEATEPGGLRQLACNETVDGVLDSATDEILGDGRPIDRYGFELTTPGGAEVRFQLRTVDATLVVDAPETRILPVVRDAGVGEAATVSLRDYPIETLLFEVIGAAPTVSGAYSLTVECSGVPLAEAILPRRSESTHGVTFAWSGLYRRLDGKGRFRRGSGLAADVQRGAFSAVLYDYDEPGSPRVLTLRGSEQPGAGATYAGAIHKTRNAVMTERVGSFEAQLTNLGSTAIRLTTQLFGEPPDTAEWVSFIFGYHGPLFFEGMTIMVDVETDDPDELALLQRFGGRFRFAERAWPTFLTGVPGSSPDGRFAGDVIPGDDGQWRLLIVDLEAMRDRIAINLVRSPHGFVGTAVILIGGRKGLVRNATGVVLSTPRSLPGR